MIIPKILLSALIALLCGCTSVSFPPQAALPAEPPPLPVMYDLAVVAAATNRVELLDDEQGKFIRVAAVPGRLDTVDLVTDATIAIQPLHLYRLELRARRAPGTSFLLHRDFLDHAHKPLSVQQAMFPGNYLIAPVWEELSTFLVAPPGACYLQLRAEVSPTTETAGSYIDLANLRVTDSGALQQLSPPRRVLTINKWTVDHGLVAKYWSPSSGAGIYRLRGHANVDAPTETAVHMILMQGDDATFHWHATTAYKLTQTLAPGPQAIEWTFYVSDRRFSHQWVRGQVVDSAATVVFTDLVLEQLMDEPEGSATLGLQTPKNR